MDRPALQARRCGSRRAPVAPAEQPGERAREGDEGLHSGESLRTDPLPSRIWWCPAAELTSGGMQAKAYLMTTGPTPVPSEVLDAYAKADRPPPRPDFLAVYERVLARPEGRVPHRAGRAAVHGVGHRRLESAITNLLLAGKRPPGRVAANFGERWKQGMPRALRLRGQKSSATTGGDTDPCRPGRALVEMDRNCVISSHLRRRPASSHVQALAAVAKEAGPSSSSTPLQPGAMPLETEAWGLDARCLRSQKALMTPPGLACVSATEAAGTAPAARVAPLLPRLEAHLNAQEKPRRAAPTAVSVIIALDVALGLLLEDGLETVFERHVRLGRACRAASRRWCSSCSRRTRTGGVVTAARIPDGHRGRGSSRPSGTTATASPSRADRGPH